MVLRCNIPRKYHVATLLPWPGRSQKQQVQLHLGYLPTFVKGITTISNIIQAGTSNAKPEIVHHRICKAATQWQAFMQREAKKNIDSTTAPMCKRPRRTTDYAHGSIHVKPLQLSRWNLKLWGQNTSFTTGILSLHAWQRVSRGSVNQFSTWLSSIFWIYNSHVPSSRAQGKPLL